LPIWTSSLAEVKILLQNGQSVTKKISIRSSIKKNHLVGSGFFVLLFKIKVYFSLPDASRFLSIVCPGLDHFGFT
jgi:hypothetical protein